MRIVHTSDWHAGRSWRGKNRLDELERVLEHLADFIEREKVELLLVSGDVFDHPAPAADAERVVFSFFKRVGRNGTPSVVIAGNHDSPARLEAWSLLAEMVDVHAVARPCPPERGGVIELRSKRGEHAVVAALPFAPLKFMIEGLDLAGNETEARQKYADILAKMIRRLSIKYRADTINLMIAHTHLAGAAKSGSERTVHLGLDWSGTKESLPSEAQYVGLGHIHKPQRLEATGAPAFYAGSPMQLDFGEVGEEKSLVLIDAVPGKPVSIERIPYEGAIPLRHVRATLDELERDREMLLAGGWLRVQVPLAELDPDLAGKVRALLPNAVKVEVEQPEKPCEEEQRKRGLDARELFADYYSETHGREAPPEVLETFDVLRLEDDAESR